MPEDFLASMNRHDTLAIIHQARREGGDAILLNAIKFHQDGRYPESHRIALQKKHGSIMEIYKSYSQEVA